MKRADNPEPVVLIERFVPFFKAFSNSTRAKIVGLLLGGERCVCEITGPIGQSQPLISHHLSLLRAAGLVRSRGEGARTYYAIDWERFEHDLGAFVEFVEAAKQNPLQRDPDDTVCAVDAGSKRLTAS
jgi:ArsR family transcriptional regulator